MQLSCTSGTTPPWQQTIGELDFITPLQVSAFHVGEMKRELMMMMTKGSGGEPAEVRGGVFRAFRQERRPQRPPGESGTTLN